MPEASRKRWHAAIAELSSLQFKLSLDAVAVSQAVAKQLQLRSSKKCEDCGLKQPTFGLPAEGGRKRWCGGCAKGHAGAAAVGRTMCEGCGLKQPNFGLPAEGGRKRWCGGCAKGHAGAVTGGRKM